MKITNFLVMNANINVKTENILLDIIEEYTKKIKKNKSTKHPILRKKKG